MTAVHHVAVATSGMEVKHDMVYRPEGTTQVINEDDVLLIKAEPVVTGPPGTLIIQQNGLMSVATSAGSVITQQQANGGLANGPFSGLGNSSGSPAASKQRRPVAPDDWLSSPSPSGGAPSLTPSPGPPAFTVISNGYSSPLSSGSYDPYSPNGKIVADSKEKWKNIRNGFVRSLKPTPSGSSSKAKKPYYLHDVMQFVLPYVKPVQHSQNTGNISLPNTQIMTQPDEDESQSTQDENVFGENNENNNNSLVAEPSTRIQETPYSVVPKRKKKFIQEKDDVDQAVLQYIKEKKVNKTPESPDDDRKMFLLSLLPDIKSLSEKNLRQFKIKTLTLLEQLITQQEQPMTYQHFQMNERSGINHSTKHHDSSASPCSSGFSVNTVSTPAPSPIDVTSTPISINYTTATDGYAITDLEYAPASTSTVRHPHTFKENEPLFFSNN